MTIRVTAFLGSFAADFRGVLRSRRFRFAVFFDLRFAIQARIVLQDQYKNSSKMRASVSCDPDLSRRCYFSASLRPAFKLSKFRIVFSTSEYVPRVSPR